MSEGLMGAFWSAVPGDPSFHHLKPSLCASSSPSSSSSVFGKSQAVFTVPFLNHWPQHQDTCMEEWLCSSTKFWNGQLHSNRSLELLEKTEVHEWRNSWGRCFKTLWWVFISVQVLLCPHTSGLAHLSSPSPTHTPSIFATCTFLSLHPGWPPPEKLLSN